MTPLQEDNPVKKWAKDMKRHFSKENIQRVQRHTKGCSASQAIRETQIKTTDIPLHTSPNGHNRTNQQTTGVGEDGEKRNPSALLVGMQTALATVENSMEFPEKTKNGTAF